ncbi:Fpg/Nei family DNA glycosylase [Evansella cellulosilytica]|uniref:Formamidopyrimidine-DNA glycosylase n=1 Tax=Evansella cellulosilytica (strain ATCC 21833 / DSM 2522 / FERM P-1141 / JCM 9156 / N-4) TaxID=649639 RepID=E6U0S2_EVAC2|nr:DNA-formamidopyrimidine glycosylase family protein [Evansella cellulosilytica]ADU29120.1 DNA-(apurinic or apyrimidinic site) lyase [Evansella cellulosilytica DSM 2522]
MPELPEMENYRLLLNERIAGQKVTGVEVTREKTINVPVQSFLKEVNGTIIEHIDRRAKHLIFKLSNGKRLVLHLMLGGVLFLGNGENDPDRTRQVTLTIGKIELFFIGLRLGYLHLVTQEEMEEQFKDLGPEPLQITIDAFNELIKKRKGMLKTTLVNQKFISGIGNLYSDEICYEARLLPERKMNELSTQEVLDLFQSIQHVLRRGISQGGYMDPLFNGDAQTGNYHAFVYDREGEACSRCQTHIVREEISSRKCFYCPNCQK